MNTQYNLDYGREFPFNNLMKQSRDVWLRNSNDTFDGTIDSNGYVTGPGTAVAYNQVVVISGSTAGMLPLGNYVLTWTGTGDCSMESTGTMAIGTPTTSTNRKEYAITDWGDSDVLYFRVPIAATDVTDVVFCHEDYEGTCGPGEADEFYSEFVNLYSDFQGGIRFMNWQATNEKDGWTDWSTRRDEDYRTYTHGAFDDGTGRVNEPGVPLEVCVRMQNLLQVPGWYCIPHEYTDAAVDSFADLIVANVDKSLKVGIEYSNETWNSGFVQYSYVQAQGLIEQAATGRFTAQNASFPSWAWSAWRSAQMMQIVEPIFAAAGLGDNLVRIIGCQVGSGEAKKALDTDCAEVYGVDPLDEAYNYHDSASPAFYWGNTTLSETQWSNNGAADDAGTKDGATKNTINMSKEELYTWWESLYTYESTVGTTTSWAWWENEIVTTRGLEMLGYEGQHHVVCVGGVAGVAAAQTIVGYYEEERFGNVTRDMMNCAVENGFGALFVFIAVAKTDADGYWGLVPKYSDWDDIATYQRLRAVKQVAGLTNNRGI
jgi:hypothetical protein